MATQTVRNANRTVKYVLLDRVIKKDTTGVLPKFRPELHINLISAKNVGDSNSLLMRHASRA
jgi:hypothetical protein